MPDTNGKEAERQAVIEQIRTAFREVRIEDGVTLHEAEAIDDYGTYGSAEERKAARLKDPESRWQDVPDEKIEKMQVFPFLDVKGTRFYIPAYMIWTLKNFERSTSVSVDATLHVFRRPGHESEIFSVLFNEEQSRAILRFLKFVAVHGEKYTDAKFLRKAIEKYWVRFGPR